MALAAFMLLALAAVGGALGVVFQRNTLYGALYLVGAFVATAILFLMLAAPFLAVVQLIVYAGAIMVLFIFVIMLLSVRYEESGEAAGIPRGSKRTVAMVMAAAMVLLLGMVSLRMSLSEGAGSKEGMTSIQALAMALYQKYMFPFEVASILLLVAIVGAVAITRRHGRGLEGSVALEDERR